MRIPSLRNSRIWVCLKKLWMSTFMDMCIAQSIVMLSYKVCTATHQEEFRAIRCDVLHFRRDWTAIQSSLLQLQICSNWVFWGLAHGIGGLQCGHHNRVPTKCAHSNERPRLIKEALPEGWEWRPHFYTGVCADDFGCSRQKGSEGSHIH